MRAPGRSGRASTGPNEALTPGHVLSALPTPRSILTKVIPWYKKTEVQGGQANWPADPSKLQGWASGPGFQLLNPVC